MTFSSVVAPTFVVSPEPALAARSGGRVGGRRSFSEQPRRGDVRASKNYYNVMRPMAPTVRFGFSPFYSPSFGYSPFFSPYYLPYSPFFSPFSPGIGFSVRLNTAKVERQLEAEKAKNAELEARLARLEKGLETGQAWEQREQSKAISKGQRNLGDLEEELAAEKAKSAELETRLTKQLAKQAT